jgi:hypothetical protein
MPAAHHVARLDGALEGLSSEVDALTRHVATVRLEFRRRREVDPQA